MKTAPFKYLDYSQVCDLVRLSKTPIRTRIKAGTFPAPIALSSRCVRFRSDQVAQWMEDQAQAVDSSKPERTAKASNARLARFQRGVSAA
jgi:prophage regulatory protein